MTLPSLAEIEQLAAARGLLLRLQVKQALAVTTLRVVVARSREGQGPLLLGELKGWALPLQAGLQLDTMRVQGKDTQGVGPLIWAATFAWALEATPCRSARLLAIRDNDQQHRRLVRYFRQLGFEPVREVGAAAMDLPLRLVWGGAGVLMRGDIVAGLQRISRRL
ncbi:MAG: hypothetical protein KXJ49_04280 [Vulcanococcus sp.]|uniref:hypothetical protein n=1 Tax=Vulcanococcus sp. TaxID=2856995 RepID=UPI0025DD0EDE|nr:hypothetical protein [Vulcanococcus sp.]MBW0166693.1 hypothetical protein [Vulcanococcus sp.]